MRTKKIIHWLFGIKMFSNTYLKLSPQHNIFTIYRNVGPTRAIRRYIPVDDILQRSENFNNVQAVSCTHLFQLKVAELWKRRRVCFSMTHPCWLTTLNNTRIAEELSVHVAFLREMEDLNLKSSLQKRTQPNHTPAVIWNKSISAIYATSSPLV
jgi:hypothetical protein